MTALMNAANMLIIMQVVKNVLTHADIVLKFVHHMCRHQFEVLKWD